MEAAQTFQQESMTQPGIDLAAITDRMEIRKAVQSGNVEEAIERVNDLNPEVRTMPRCKQGETHFFDSSFYHVTDPALVLNVGKYRYIWGEALALSTDLYLLCRYWKRTTSCPSIYSSSA